MAQDCVPGEKDRGSTLGSLSGVKRMKEFRDVNINDPSETDRGSFTEGPHS